MALSPSIQKARDEGLSLIDPLRAAVAEMHITTEDEYLVADAMLGRIQAARKRWSARIGLIIDPLWEALKSGRELKNEVDKPLEEFEGKVKVAMKSFKLEEQRQIQAAKDEEDRLRQEAEQKEQAAAAAKTVPMKERLNEARRKMEDKADDASAKQIPVAANASATRMSKKWRVTDADAFIKGVSLGVIPQMALSVNTVGVNGIFKAKGGHEVVAAWPGVEVYDDIDIVGR